MCQSVPAGEASRPAGKEHSDQARARLDNARLECARVVVGQIAATAQG